MRRVAALIDDGRTVAQTAAAVLGHNFPDSPWYSDAYRLVRAGGLEPAENKGSWISRAFANPFASGSGSSNCYDESKKDASLRVTRDPATGKIADDVEQQTEQCLKNVQTILEAAGSGLQHVLRCGVFLLDMGEFKKMNGVYARMFGEHRPARTTVQVAGLPGEGLRVEIDAIAYKP